VARDSANNFASDGDQFALLTNSTLDQAPMADSASNPNTSMIIKTTAGVANAK